MFVKRNQIIYIPYPIRGNKINESQLKIVEILKKKYSVSGNLIIPTNIYEILHIKAIFLNWAEEYLDNSMKYQLLLYQLFGVKIIWVFHNKLPHDVKASHKIVNNMKWLADKSNIICLFSKNSQFYIPNKKKNQKKSFYIPHIIYQSHINKIDLNSIRKKYGILESDFVFTIFGLIRPYKNIEGGIEAFIKLNLPNSKLIIAGNPVNSQYAKKIKKMGIENKNIIFDLQYLSNLLLDGIIAVSDVIVLPYHNTSSMNSGVMIQAFSNGKTVIAPDICMTRDFKKEKFLYSYRYSLEKVMKTAYKNGKAINEKMGKQAQDYVKKNHSEEIVSHKLFSMLEIKNNQFKSEFRNKVRERK